MIIARNSQSSSIVSDFPFSLVDIFTSLVGSTITGSSWLRTTPSKNSLEVVHCT